MGLADVAGRYPRELPFGLQKRADLARAVAEGADLILLDAPFGGLDGTDRAILAASDPRPQDGPWSSSSSESAGSDTSPSRCYGR